jgi:penicillin-binding protein 2
VVTPYLVDKIVTAHETYQPHAPSKELIPLKADNINSVVSAMVNVIHSSYGTAKGIAKNLNYHIAGKTGTAQVFNIKQNAKYNENAIDFKLRDHALFISFAPAENPQIAVAVVVENGGHGGTVAAPIAAQVIDQYLKENHEN